MDKNIEKILKHSLSLSHLTDEEIDEILNSNGYEKFIAYEKENGFIPFFCVYRSLSHFGEVNSEIGGRRENDTDESFGKFLLDRYEYGDDGYWAIKLKSGRIVTAYIGK